MYRAKVISNDDPFNLGRLQVSAAQLHGAEVFTEWVYPAMPLYDGRGLYFVPKKGDIVWLLFENEDKRHPYWLPAHQLRKKHKISVEQKATKDQILLYYGDNIFFQIDEKKETIFIVNHRDKSMIRLKDSELYLQQGADTTVTMVQNEISIKQSSTEVNLSAAGTAIRRAGISLRTPISTLFQSCIAIATFLQGFGLPPNIATNLTSALAQFNAVIKS